MDELIWDPSSSWNLVLWSLRIPVLSTSLRYRDVSRLGHRPARTISVGMTRSFSKFVGFQMTS